MHKTQKSVHFYVEQGGHSNSSRKSSTHALFKGSPITVQLEFRYLVCVCVGFATKCNNISFSKARGRKRERETETVCPTAEKVGFVGTESYHYIRRHMPCKIRVSYEETWSEFVGEHCQRKCLISCMQQLLAAQDYFLTTYKCDQAHTDRFVVQL